MKDNPLNRRDFLRGATLSSIGLAFGGQELSAHAQGSSAGQAKPGPAGLDDEVTGRPVRVAVIGLGSRGKEILASLAKMTDKFAPVAVICDTFDKPLFVKKSTDLAPNATFVTDYKKVLDDKTIEAVFIATPTHKHKQIALDAIQTGKHVFLEAPLAHTVEDAKAIAQAAKSANTVFQPGLQVRCNPQALHVRNFVESGALGKLASGRAQHHERKTNGGRIGWPTPEREAELNWRLSKESSNGLVGEVGIHQIDTASWYLKSLPVAVSGFGSVVEFNDGRTTPDTVQLIVEYPRNFRYAYDATVTNGFDGTYELFLGSESAVILRDLRGWMFREGDAPLLGWEVFARKDPLKVGAPENGTGLAIGTGIALVANATKQLALGLEPGKVGTDVSKSALYQSCRVFLNSVRAGKSTPAREPTKDHPSPALAPGALEGYQATVVAIKAAEAAANNTRIVFEKEWFTL